MENYIIKYKPIDLFFPCPWDKKKEKSAFKPVG
jgi:tRNA G46 methylase TrmB